MGSLKDLSTAFNMHLDTILRPPATKTWTGELKEVVDLIIIIFLLFFGSASLIIFRFLGRVLV